MKPTEREILIDLACSSEGFTRFEPPFEGRHGGPEFIPEEAHSFDVILDDGERRERLFAEDVQWWRVLAWRCEDLLGNPLDPEEDDDFDGDYDDHAEPDSIVEDEA